MDEIYFKSFSDQISNYVVKIIQLNQLKIKNLNIYIPTKYLYINKDDENGTRTIICIVQNFSSFLA